MSTLVQLQHGECIHCFKNFVSGSRVSKSREEDPGSRVDNSALKPCRDNFVHDRKETGQTVKHFQVQYRSISIIVTHKICVSRKLTFTFSYSTQFAEEKK